jgi:hypothetical protein
MTRVLKKHRLTLFGRSALLLGSELLVNAACWTAAGILFGRDPATQPILSLALLAWVTPCLFVYLPGLLLNYITLIRQSD